MKKLIIITLAAIAFTTAEAQAQNWLNALKSAATSAIDKVTGGALTEKAIIGTWNYSQPGVKLSSSENALSDITGSALTTTVQQKIAPLYNCPLHGLQNTAPQLPNRHCFVPHYYERRKV